MKRICAAVVCCMLALACDAEPERPKQLADEEADFEPIVQTNALADNLKKAHSVADQAKTREQRHAAATRLETVFNELKDDAPHAVALKQDLAARVAQLRLDVGETEQAVSFAKEGLALSEKSTVLRANLLIVLADAEEKLGNEAAAQDALLGALSINEELFNEELENP